VAADGVNTIILTHRETDTVDHVPCAFLSDAERTRHLVTGHAVLGVRHQPHCRQPLVQTNSRVLKDRSDLDGKLALGVAGLALPYAARRNVFHCVRTARRALDHTVGPTAGDQESNAVIGIGVVNDGLL